MGTLNRAIAIAAEAHAGQTNKAGQPYILHSLRVMLRLATDEERGVLHDVVEDCDGWTFERLRAEGFSETIIAALDGVTKREGEDYETFVRRSGQNDVSRRVKLADLFDNSDVSRLADPSERDLARMERYRRGIAVLERLEAQQPWPS